MPVRRYCLSEARKIVEYKILAQGNVFTEEEWLLAVLRALPRFAERKVHHLDEEELGKLLKAVEDIIAQRPNP